MVERTKMWEIAKALAEENKKAEPTISKVFWFPDDEEVRLVEVDEQTCQSDVVTPFHFGPNEAQGLPVPSGIALIRPEEVRKIDLPVDWGSWDDAEEI